MNVSAKEFFGTANGLVLSKVFAAKEVETACSGGFFYIKGKYFEAMCGLAVTSVAYRG